MNNNLYDIFITHAWRYHDDWTRMEELLDSYKELNWRNFSVPWHDPAMEAHTEIGGKYLRSLLESQIIPVCGVILLNSVYETKSSRKWVDYEVEIAKKHHKTILAVPSFGTNDVLNEVKKLADMIVSWNGEEIINSLYLRAPS